MFVVPSHEPAVHSQVPLPSQCLCLVHIPTLFILLDPPNVHLLTETQSELDKHVVSGEVVAESHRHLLIGLQSVFVIQSYSVNVPFLHLRSTV